MIDGSVDCEWPNPQNLSIIDHIIQGQYPPYGGGNNLPLLIHTVLLFPFLVLTLVPLKGMATATVGENGWHGPDNLGRRSFLSPLAHEGDATAASFLSRQRGQNQLELITVLLHALSSETLWRPREADRERGGEKAGKSGIIQE